jgi:hypothetical protein
MGACVVIALRTLAGVAGGALVIAALVSAVKTVVLPRATSSVIIRADFILVRRLLRLLGLDRQTFATRDRVLAFYAPVCLLLLPGIWVAMVISGFMLVMWGIAGGSMREAFEVSGSSMLTLGFQHPGDLTRIVLTFVEATLGLGLVALLISYLPTVYGGFQRRESLVGLLEARAGTPPSAAQILTRYQTIGALDTLDTELFALWEEWFTDIEESHTSNPSLVFFRSPQPARSWITAAGCILDTASVRASTIDRPRSGQTELMIRSGFLCLRRIADYFGIRYDPNARPDDPISVSRGEFDLLLVELQAADLPLKADRDQAWRDWAGWRVNYDTVLVGLAALVDAPPGRWSSDRVLPTRTMPHLFRRTSQPMPR